MLILAAALGIAGLFLYRACGISQFSTKLSPEVQIGYCAGVVICIVSLFYSRKPIKFIGYLALLYAFVQSIAVQAKYVANVFAAIDGNSFSTVFLMMAVISLLAVITALVATILKADAKEA